LLPAVPLSHWPKALAPAALLLTPNPKAIGCPPEFWP
jgi:hypothetical protein